MTTIKLEVKDKGYLCERVHTMQDPNNGQPAFELMQQLISELKNEVLMGDYKLTAEQADNFKIEYEDEEQFKKNFLRDLQKIAVEQKGMLLSTLTNTRLTATNISTNQSLDFFVTIKIHLHEK